VSAKKRAPATVDLAVLLDSWLLALRAERKSDKTVKVYGDGVRMFLRWCDRTGTPAELAKSTVQAFVVALLEGGAEPATARSRQLSLKRFSAWLTAEGEIDDDVLLGLRPPKIDVKVADPLTGDELRALIKACQGKTMRDRRDEAIIRLMTETGMRAGEVANLQATDVDLARGIAVVRRGKGGKGRIVPFGAQTASAIDRYQRLRRTHLLADTTALWLGDRGKTFSYHAMHRSLGYRAKVAGIDRFHPHLLRHTAASRWLAAGGSEGGLMAVAGWATREMLDRYVAATASERAAAEARGLNLGEL
jgi:site-specific recombinase XerD